MFARYRTPTDIIGRWRLADYNLPIRIGSVEVSPGDYILGDRDGVLAIPARAAEEVIARAEDVVQTENQVRNDILAGIHPLEAYRRHGRF